MWFLLALALFTLGVTVLSEATGIGLVSTSFVKTLGKTLCLCLVAIAMDVVWGYCGILSLGHMAFFALGGYAIGHVAHVRPDRDHRDRQPDGRADPADRPGDRGRHRHPDLRRGGVEPVSLGLGLRRQPGTPAPDGRGGAGPSRARLRLARLPQPRHRRLSLDPDAGDDARPLALPVPERQRARGNNGLSGLQNIPGYDGTGQAWISMVFFWASALALGLGYVLFAWVVSGKMGSVIRGIRDNEARVRFLGYPVEGFKLFVFTLTAIVAGIAGALYYPQAGIINPAELAPIASIYLAVWVAIGGRGRLYGAVIGAAFVSLLSSWFTGGSAPPIDLGFYTIRWTDWWLVLLGLSFVAVTLFAPKGIGGIFDWFTARKAPDREGDYGPDDGALRREEGAE
jgi:urea transport system permease protein